MTQVRLALFFSVGLAFGGGQAAGAGEAPLAVSVAVSLRPALEQALVLYRVEAPGVDLLLNSGASGVLLQQARRGAPADALISASSREIDILVDEGLALSGTRRQIASNTLVVLVPRGSEPPETIDGLSASRFSRLAVANPKTAPLGRYTRQALERAGLWDRLAARLVPAANARQTLDYVARGEVDAGIVYASDARLMAGRVTPGPEISGELHDPIVYEGVVLADTRQAEQALALLDWLAGERGRVALVRHGFLAP